MHSAAWYVAPLPRFPGGRLYRRLCVLRVADQGGRPNLNECSGTASDDPGAKSGSGGGANLLTWELLVRSRRVQHVLRIVLISPAGTRRRRENWFRVARPTPVLLESSASVARNAGPGNSGAGRTRRPQPAGKVSTRGRGAVRADPVGLDYSIWPGLGSLVGWDHR